MQKFKATKLPLVIGLLTVILSGSVWLYLRRDSMNLSVASQITCTPVERCKKFTAVKHNFSFMYPDHLQIFDKYDEQLEGQFAYKITSHVVVEDAPNLKDRTYTGPRTWLSLQISTLPSDYVKDGDYDIPDPSFKKLKNDERILQKIRVNGQVYSLVKYSHESGDEYVQLAQCQPDNSCSTAIKRSDGTYISVEIGTFGETGHQHPNLDSSNSSYTELVSIIGSMNF